MFGFLVGWGTFWLLLWVVTWMVGLIMRHEGFQGCGALGSIISLIFLIAVAVGKLVSGI